MKGNVSVVAKVLSVVSTGLAVVCRGGADIVFIKALDKDSTQKAGFQYFFTLSSIQVEKLTHKTSFSVIGKTNKFSLSRTLSVRLSGMLDEPWVHSTRFLSKVRFIAIKCINHVLMSFGLSNSCALKSPEDAGLDLHSRAFVVQEMFSHWAKIVSYNNETGQRQEFQNVQGRVTSVILLVPICLCGLAYALVILQGQAFDMQVIGEQFFQSRLEMLKVISQDYRESFKRFSCPKHDQGFFLCGQMLDFLHRFLRRIVERDT